MANIKTSLGQVDGGQQDFISIMLSGVQSVAHAAEIGGFPLSTVRKWMRVGHPVRAEYEKQKEAIDLLVRHWKRTLEDERASAWNKNEAARQLREYLELTPSDEEAREKRNKKRRGERSRADMKKWEAENPGYIPSWRDVAERERGCAREEVPESAEDAREGPQPPPGRVPVLSLVGTSPEDSPRAS
jgi:hypothetical protein